jgi:hypothetical protein
VKVRRKKGIAVGVLANIAVTAARKKKNSAGAAPVVFRYVKTALRKTNGVSATARLGSVLTVNVFA